MNRWGSTSLFVVLVVLGAGGLMRSGAAPQQAGPSSSPAGSKEREAIGRFVNVFCVECHNSEDKTGGLALDALAGEDLSRNSKAWEKVVRKLAVRQMPPDDAIRPFERAYDSIISTLTGALDRAAAEHPEPGRTDTFRRLNRAEVPERHPRPSWRSTSTTRGCCRTTSRATDSTT